MHLGPYRLPNNVFVAPMAGVTDRPFRQLCRSLGAGYAVSEMAASNPKLWASVKTARRLNHDGEPTPKAVQIAGADPSMMADAARFNVAAVAAAVEVPVTVKLRTGPSPKHRNAVALARALESAGAAMITVHGRTRACAFGGQAEYDTIAEVKRAVGVPVVANGDIDSPAKAAFVLARTGADAVMIGRAAQGRPWIFREIDHFLRTGELLEPPGLDEIRTVLRGHLVDHYAFYGEHAGPRIARKHIGWYIDGWCEDRRFAAGLAHRPAPMQTDAPPERDDAARLRDAINRADRPEVQLALLDDYLDHADDRIAVH